MKNKWFILYYTVCGLVLGAVMAFSHSPSESQLKIYLILMTGTFATVGGWVVSTGLELRKEAGQLKLARKFVENFLDAETLQSAVDKKLEEKANLIEETVQGAIRLQRNGLAGFDLNRFSNDDSIERDFETVRRRINDDVKVAKDVFWVLYDLAEICANEFPVKVRTPRSYKNYLPTSSWQSGIPAEKA